MASVRAGGMQALGVTMELGSTNEVLHGVYDMISENLINESNFKEKHIQRNFYIALRSEVLTRKALYLQNNSVLLIVLTRSTLMLEPPDALHAISILHLL